MPPPLASTGTLAADPVTITLSGTAFALTRQTLDVDVDGNGGADLIGATLDSIAFSAGRR